MSQKPHYVYEFGNCRFDPNTWRLLEDDREICLGNKAKKVLWELLKAWPSMLTFKQACEGVWEQVYDPDRESFHNTLRVTVDLVRTAIGKKCVVSVAKHGYLFNIDVRKVPPIEKGNTPASNPSHPLFLEPPVGALPLDSPVYISRTADGEFQKWISQRCSFILIRGPRQTGKTSLLARGRRCAQETGALVAFTDCQSIAASAFVNVEQFFLALAESLALELDLATRPSPGGKNLGLPGQEFQRYVEDEVLGQIAEPIVWMVDEVDRLFACQYRDEVFARFRFWHNRRATKPEQPWGRLTVAMAYATEPHLFSADLSQSPFNVGMRIALEDFSLVQVAELNRRYDSPLPEDDLKRFSGLVGGHPYLVNYGLFWMADHQCGLAGLEACADQDDGPYGEHLRRIWTLLDADLLRVVIALLQNQSDLTTAEFYRLRTAGVLTGDAPRNARLRCQLYENYLRKHLL
jgi:DNA-binding winged helix-turn-helix (wHTH) protein